MTEEETIGELVRILREIRQLAEDPYWTTSRRYEISRVALRGIRFVAEGALQPTGHAPAAGE